MSVTLEEKVIAEQIAEGFVCEFRLDDKLNLNKLRTLKQVKSANKEGVISLGLGCKHRLVPAVAKETLFLLHEEDELRPLLDAVLPLL